jgi:hypothetical protein
MLLPASSPFPFLPSICLSFSQSSSPSWRLLACSSLRYIRMLHTRTPALLLCCLIYLPCKHLHSSSVTLYWYFANTCFLALLHYIRTLQTLAFLLYCLIFVPCKRLYSCCYFIFVPCKHLHSCSYVILVPCKHLHSCSVTLYSYLANTYIPTEDVWRVEV